MAQHGYDGGSSDIVRALMIVLITIYSGEGCEGGEGGDFISVMLCFFSFVHVKTITCSPTLGLARSPSLPLRIMMYNFADNYTQLSPYFIQFV